MSVSETYAGNIVAVQGPWEYQAKASGALNEGRVVELNTTVTDRLTVLQGTDNSQKIIGYVDADWEASDAATIYQGGIARLEDSGAGISNGAQVVCGGSGKIKTYASGLGAATIIGIAVETITAAAFGKVLVNISHNDG